MGQTCFGVWVDPTVTKCSDGSAPVPFGPQTPTNSGATTSTPSTVTTTPQWNADTTPVQVGSTPRSPNAARTPDALDTPNMTTVFEAHQNFNRIYGAAHVKGATPQAVDEYNKLISGLRSYTGSKLGTRGSAEQAYYDALKDASRSNVDVMDLLGGTGSGGSNGSGGPKTMVSTNYLDPQSAEMLLNKLAVDKLGRNLTSDELSKYVSDFHSREGQNASVTHTNGSGSSTTQAGMADADIADSIIRQNPAFADNVLKTDVLDMFYKRIGGRNG